MKIGIMLLTGPYQQEGADSAYHFASAALARGHEVLGIFLYTDAVNNVNARIDSPGSRNLAKMFSELGATVRIVACGTCAKFRGVTKDMLVPNSALGGMGALVKMITDCDRFVVFGGG
jgi:tRNA 2-thiouridine synthesizing protein D